MKETAQIQLKTTSILNIPFKSYAEDFTFIVNDKEFKTNRLIADILSPAISRIHLNDPTFDTFTINTQQTGDFSHVLDLLNFTPNDIPTKELPFVSEVMEYLCNESINLVKNEELTIDNIFTEIQLHDKYKKFYSQNYEAEIDFLSSHFYEICDDYEEEILKLQNDMIYKIINNEKLQISSEDQLLNFINKIYIQNPSYSFLYDSVLFANVTKESIIKFIEIFNINDLTNGTWKEITKRLIDCNQNKKRIQNERYKFNSKHFKIFEYSEEKLFDGIINFLKNESQGQIEKEINITASSYYSESRKPSNVVNYNDTYNFFFASAPNSWICFDFRNHLISPSHYTIRSVSGWNRNNYHPKEWVIEGSNDNLSWEIIDEQKDCPYLNGKGLIHTFVINNNEKQNEFRYIRLRSTGPSWSDDFLGFNSLEFYGKLI